MDRFRNELAFLRTLISLNLASAMEYRASFISQIVGMFLNNGIYFVFWLIFFERFGTVRGYNIGDIYLLFAVVALGFGLAHMLAGNVGPNLAYLIAQGRLDYYLVFPRNLLTHVIFSRMIISAIGDLSFGLIAYLFTGRFHPLEIGLFLLTSVLVAFIFIGFSVITGSLAFFMGNAQYTSQQMSNAVVTFALYPNTLFSGFSRFLLYSLIPAGFVGAMPVEIIKERNATLLLALAAAAVVAWVVAAAVFYYGLRRYESGSAINVNV
jgi:ABC-2 type transport system permease protein